MIWRYIMNKILDSKIKSLIKEHKTLDWEIKKLQALSPYRDDDIKVLKKRKLSVKDLIEALKNDTRETV
tara:strand:- start:762 stop:968 length:207 start_codon:yes stop_codon:yes gene_type:complete